MIEFYKSTCPKARKDHKCDLCGGTIHIGEKYHRYSGKYDGDMFDEKYHLICQNIINSYCDETGDWEYNNDCIQDWLRDKYCYDCKHGADEDDDCTYLELSCPLIRNHYENEGGEVYSMNTAVEYNEKTFLTELEDSLKEMQGKRKGE